MKNIAKANKVFARNGAAGTNADTTESLKGLASFIKGGTCALYAGHAESHQRHRGHRDSLEELTELWEEWLPIGSMLDVSPSGEIILSTGGNVTIEELQKAVDFFTLVHIAMEDGGKKSEHVTALIVKETLDSKPQKPEYAIIRHFSFEAVGDLITGSGDTTSLTFEIGNSPWETSDPDATDDDRAFRPRSTFTTTAVTISDAHALFSKA